MDAQFPTIRELSPEECESTSGGFWGPLVALGAAAIAGSVTAILTAPEKAVVPKLDLPPSEEPVRW